MSPEMFGVYRAALLLLVNAGFLVLIVIVPATLFASWALIRRLPLRGRLLVPADTFGRGCWIVSWLGLALTPEIELGQFSWAMVAGSSVGHLAALWVQSEAVDRLYEPKEPWEI
ncbi:MAG: hypothetical protein WA989_05245 [Henriciella sp.]|uniref:hypothetical protein n=1 Tax=Henriciella sp. TaxID=1968823 RepID=UPI003C789E27